jgi:tRNA pseudouridine38-40 synthase
MRTLKLTLSYDGTAYVGWQRQENGVSVQERVEDAFRPLAAKPDGSAPTVIGAGRTDAGAHALGQVASVNVEIDLPTEPVQRALNVRLPMDIRIVAVSDEKPGFHARYHAAGKRYRYRVVTAPVMSPFDRLWAWHAPGRYDVGAMQRAAAALVGRHDFASFQTSGSPVTDTIRTLHQVEVRELDGEVAIEVSGDGFLRHMVRALAGTLLDVGSGRRAPESIPGVLSAADRAAAGPTLPAHGLTLVSVWY